MTNKLAAFDEGLKIIAEGSNGFFVYKPENTECHEIIKLTAKEMDTSIVDVKPEEG